MPSDTPALVIRDWSVGYLDQPIVCDFETTVKAGTVTCLIGGNGAGKSTLLKSIFGLNKRFSGSMLFEGDPIHLLSPDARVRRGIGLVPQGRCNFPRMTVRENLEMGAYTLPRAQASAAMERVVTLFPMLRRKWRIPAGYLSGGEQQVLETAMVLESAPRLLLLDEPSLGLAPLVVQQIFAIIRELNTREALTVFLVEQNAFHAHKLAHRAYVMVNGLITLTGTGRELLERPEVRAAYLEGGKAGAPEPGAGAAHR